MPSARSGLFGVLVRKEIAANLLSYKFFVVILLAAVLIFTSLFVLSRDFKERRADYDLIRPQPGEPIAVLPPNPLSVYAKGLDEAMGRSFEIQSIGVEVRAGRSSGNAIFGFFPAPDFIYLVKVVLALVALLFGFDAVSREREDGTLKLMLSHSVRRPILLLGKWLGGFASLAVPFLIITGMGVALTSLDPTLRLPPTALARLGLILAAALIYMALFLSLGLLISASVRRSATSLVVGLLAWTVLVFVLPNLGTLAARQLVEVPSVRSLTEKRQQIWTREVLLSYADRGSWERRIRAIHEEIDRLEEDYRLRFDRLVRLSKAINRISPSAGFVNAATELAGTGIGEESRLKAEVIRYKSLALPALARDRTAKLAPAFAYRYRSVGKVLAEGALADLAWLAVSAILLFAGAAAVFLRADPR